MKCKYGFYTCSFIGQVDFCNSCEGGQNYQMKQETRGGKREGSGRPKKEPTKTLSYRVPLKNAAKIDLSIRKVIASILTLILVMIFCSCTTSKPCGSYSSWESKHKFSK